MFVKIYCLHVIFHFTILFSLALNLSVSFLAPTTAARLIQKSEMTFIQLWHRSAVSRHKHSPFLTKHQTINCSITLIQPVQFLIALINNYFLPTSSCTSHPFWGLTILTLSDGPALWHAVQSFLSYSELSEVEEMQSDYLHLHPTNSNLVTLCFGAIGRVLGILGKLFWPKNDPKMLPYVSRLPTIMSRFRHLSVSQNASGSPFVFTYQTPFMSPLTVKTKPTWILAAATCFCWLKYRSSLYCRKKKRCIIHRNQKSHK